jgi:hypothetical protein
MSVVEWADIKPGQTIHVRMVVKTVPEPGRFLCPETVVDLDGEHHPVLVMIEAEQIVHVEPIPPNVGELVTWGRAADAYKLVSIEEDGAGRKWGVIWHKVLGATSMPLDDLVRA